MQIRRAALPIRTASMTRTHRGLLIIPMIAMWACGGGEERGTGGESAAVAVPPVRPPADATPWQVRPEEPCGTDSAAPCPAGTTGTP